MTDYTGAENFILNKLERELPSDLYYHGLHHVHDVLNAALHIAEMEGITNEEDIRLLRVAVLFHDSGFIYVYRGHEEKGCEMVREYLPAFGFTEDQMSTICGMIMSTKLPQKPFTELEKIVADADVDYLGRSDFYSIAETLFREMKLHIRDITDREWNEIQLKFLRSHKYKTQYCIETREPEVQKRIREIEQIVNSYP